MKKLTNHETDHADALAQLVASTTLDQLIDKWTEHGYRPSLRVAFKLLADYYDRRAAERGIDVRAYRG
jgi:hypothetical protein